MCVPSDPASDSAIVDGPSTQFRVTGYLNWVTKRSRFQTRMRSEKKSAIEARKTKGGIGRGMENRSTARRDRQLRVSNNVAHSIWLWLVNNREL